MEDAQQVVAEGDVSKPAAATTTTVSHRSKADFEKILLEQYTNREFLHSAAIVEGVEATKNLYTRLKGETDDYRKIRSDYRHWFPPSRIYGQGYEGYGNGHTEIGNAKVMYPVNKPRLGHRKTARLRIKRKDLASQAEQVEELVPIRLDVDWDKIKLRDTFTWNLHDRTVPSELFAAQFIEDLGLALPAANPVLEQVHQQLTEQLNDFYPPVYIEEDALDPELPYSAYKNDEMRILIKLNITIGPHTLEDKFEWEINNPLNSPEEFAQSMTRELSLSGEFTTAIAHCIREQVQLFVRSLYVIGHPFDGRPVEDSDLVSAMLQSPLPQTFRPAHQAREYGPYLYEVTEADLERSEVIYSREQRRQKRSVNRRGGPTLPDLKDRQRTVRTLVVSSVIPGAAETIEESRIYKRVSGGGGRSKRPGRDGDVSDSSESEDTGPDSPAMNNLLSGTARTRNMRGAATAAQQRMANLGRSETPEAATLHHHETRTSARRFGQTVREESLDSPSMIVKLKIGRENVRKLKAGHRFPKPSSSTRPQSAAGTPARSMAPPSTPGTQHQSLAGATTPQAQTSRTGNSNTGSQGQTPGGPPPPPAWLTTALERLRETYPHDSFEPAMRYSAVYIDTEQPVVPAPPAGPPPAGVKYMYLPRIRCLDCPGKLYTPGPEQTVSGFEVHLKIRQHRDRVDLRSGVRNSGGL